jgi:hypothetical protein
MIITSYPHATARSAFVNPHQAFHALQLVSSRWGLRYHFLSFLHTCSVVFFNYDHLSALETDTILHKVGRT